MGFLLSAAKIFKDGKNLDENIVVYNFIFWKLFIKSEIHVLFFSS